jgi:hypothetical protein
MWLGLSCDTQNDSPGPPPPFLQNLKVYYHVHNSQLLHIINQSINPSPRSLINTLQQVKFLRQNFLASRPAKKSLLSQLVISACTTFAQHSLYLEKAFFSIKYHQIWYVKVTEKNQHGVHKINTVHILFNQIIISLKSTGDQMLSKIFK